eukprot:10984945-Prorocentrum_lima.AAC.1
MDGQLRIHPETPGLPHSRGGPGGPSTLIVGALPDMEKTTDALEHYHELFENLVCHGLPNGLLTGRE